MKFIYFNYYVKIKPLHYFYHILNMRIESNLSMNLKMNEILPMSIFNYLSPIT